MITGGINYLFRLFLEIFRPLQLARLQYVVAQNDKCGPVAVSGVISKDINP